DFANDEFDAIEINKLLKQLEVAIGNGSVEKASNLARKLAEYKVKCSVVRKKSNLPRGCEEIAVNLFIEDRLSHTGPITLYINPMITVGQLKKKIEREFDFPTYLQKWILGKKLAVDDNATISYFNVMSGCAVFLYLTVENPDRSVMYRNKLEAYLKAVDSFDIDNLNCRTADISDNKRNNIGCNFSGTNVLDYSPKKEEPPPVGWNCPQCTLLNDPTRPGCKACTTARPEDYQIPLGYKLTPEEEERLKRETELEEEYHKEEERIQIEADKYKAENYQRFIDLEEIQFVANVQTFECKVCESDIDVGEGITIRECLHTFCRECIAGTIEYSETAEVKCPYSDANFSCDALLQDREIRAIVTPDIYDKHLLKSMITAENQAANSYHCQTPDCHGWCFYEDDINQFPCPVCKHMNCLTCKAIHEGSNCKQYQDQLEYESATNENARKTKEVLDTMLREGNGMRCPGCGIIIMKKMGCDWLMCTMCRLEICWVTKGPRWGPGGKNDTSGGCRCGINGKCHYACSYCH
uniref:RanBP-type and C3HC4-type zinc finger-containing protein 1 n=1 Tax=Strigamia maritima TaxID=126957 RepID=T1JMG8_STRMM